MMKKVRSTVAIFVSLLLLLQAAPIAPAVYTAWAEDVPLVQAPLVSEPEQAPTQAPTEEPTQAPTEEPTQAPTVEPTQAPTVEPFASPSVDPSEPSTVEPSASPSVDSSESPPVEPSMEPSASPSVEPSESPEPVVLVETLSLLADSTELFIGDTAQLNVAALPEDAADVTVTYTTADETIAIVDETGRVTALAAGQVEVTATANDGGGAVASLLMSVVERKFEGDGTQESPYALYTADDLQTLSALVSAGDARYMAAGYALMADLDLNNVQWSPIGTEAHPFEGTFDGQGHKLRGLTFRHTTQQSGGFGLFGVTSGAHITRVAIETGNMNITAPDGVRADAGLIVGRMLGGSLTISYTTGTIDTSTQTGATGGLVGSLQGGTVDNCFSLAVIKARQGGGVLAGEADGGAQILHCYHRSDPLYADTTVTLGDDEGVSLQSIYTLSDADSIAKPLDDTSARSSGVYSGFDFDSVWQMTGSDQYPFPVLSENAYTGVVTYAGSEPQDHSYGYIPFTGTIRQSRPAAGTHSLQSDSMPSYYDRRALLPAVRNQNPFGTCWAFSAVGAVEANMIKKGLASTSIDLAEIQNWFTKKGARVSTGIYEDPLNNFQNDHTDASQPLNGGNVLFTMYAYASGIMANQEDLATQYTIANVNSAVSSGLPYEYAFSKAAAHIKGVSIAYPKFTDDVKRLIMEYGAAVASYIHDDIFYVSDTYAYYVPANPTYSGYQGGHAILLVGWDDNFSRYNFASDHRPSGDGAWLVRNSWGSRWGDGGYFWMSYESQDGFLETACVAFETEDIDEYDRLYQYDGANTYGFTYSGGNTAYQANVFEAQQDEKIISAGFWVSQNSNVSYSIEAYKLNENYTSPTDGVKITTAPTTGTTTYPGFYKVNLSTNQTLTKGERFSVVVKMTGTEDIQIEIDTGFNYTWIWGYGYGQQGQSYLGYHGYDWYDLNDGATTVGEGENVRVKVYTADEAYPSGVTITGGDVVAVGGTLALNANVQPYAADQSVVWSVTDETGSATISESGVLTGVSAGTVTVTATTTALDESEQPKSAQKQITVKAPVTGVSIAIPTPSLATGTTYRLAATVLPSTLPAADRSVTWEMISGTSNATVTADGLLTCKRAGSITVQAVSSGISLSGAQMAATQTITIYQPTTAVTISMPNVAEMTIGETSALSAIVTPGGADQSGVTWSTSGETGVLSVDKNGSVTALGTGTGYVVAQAPGRNAAGQQATSEPFAIAVYEVANSASLDENPSGITIGMPIQLSAQVLPTGANQRVTWSVKNGTGSATVTQAGLLTPQKAGTVTITATTFALDAGRQPLTAQKQLTIHPYVTGVSVAGEGGITMLTTGATLQMRATVSPTTAVQGVTWAVTDGTGSATIHAQTGVLTGVRAGTVTVEATSVGVNSRKANVVGKCVITVVDTVQGVSVWADDYVTGVQTNKTLHFNAKVAPDTANQNVTFSIVDGGTGSATINEKTGVLTPTGAGTVVVRATSDGVTSGGVHESSDVTVTLYLPVTKLSVSAVDSAVSAGTTLQMQAAIEPAEANPAVQWSVKNGTGSATIDENGVLTGVATGTVTVQAKSVGTLKNGKALTASTKITVLTPAQSVLITANAAEVLLASSLQMSAAVLPEAASQSVAWSVIDGTGSATISPYGRLTATKRGTITVVATALTKNVAGEYPNSQYTLTVVPPKYPVTGIDVTSSMDTVGVGLLPLQMAATITPTNASVGTVTWSVENGTGEATITQNGLLLGTKLGTVTVLATSNDGENIVGRKQIEVTSVDVNISQPQSIASLTAGQSLALTAGIAPSAYQDGAVYLWSVAQGGEAFASVDENGVVTAVADVLEPQAVTIVSQTADGRANAGSYVLTLYPAATHMVIFKEGVPCSDEPIMVDMNTIPQEGEELSFSATITPTNAQNDIVWSLTNCEGAALERDPQGNAKVILTKPCRVVLKATAADGTGVSAQVVIHGYADATNVVISGVDRLSPGATARLYAAVTPETAVGAGVVWSIPNAAEKEYANIDEATGRLTISQDALVGKNVTVQATAIGDDQITAQMSIMIAEPARSLSITDEQGNAIQSDAGYTFNLNDAGNHSYRVQVAAESSGAYADIRCHSENPAVATVHKDDATGMYIITPVGAGETSVHFETADGSVERVSLHHIRVDYMALALTISGENEVMPGKSTRLSASLSPASVTNNQVRWSVNEAGVTINQKGVLSVKGNCTDASITVTATAVDGGAQGTYTVNVTPKMTAVTLVKAGEQGIQGEPINTRTGESLDLSVPELSAIRVLAVATPQNASQRFTWTENANGKVVSLATNADGSATLTAVANGKATITATALDGSKKKASFKVTVSTQATKLVINGATEENGENLVYVAQGKSVSLTAQLEPTTVSQKKLTWRLVDGTSEHVTLSAQGKLKANKLAAGNRISAVVETIDGSALAVPFAIVVTDDLSTSVSIQDGQGNNVSGKTIELDMAQAGAELRFTATALPFERGVSWKNSSEKTASMRVLDDNSVVVTPINKGTITLTATATDGSNRKATVKVKIVKLVHHIDVSLPAQLAKGKTAKPVVSFTPSDANNRKLSWALGENEGGYATINKSTGAIKALVGGNQTIHVTATALDSGGATTQTYPITLVDVPTTTVTIRNEITGVDITKKTVNLYPDMDALVLSAATNGTSQELLWTNSAPRIATMTVDEKTGRVTVVPLAKGTTTIKAVACDGSGKSATVRVSVAQKASRIQLAAEHPAIISTGRVYAYVYPASLSAKQTLKWSCIPAGAVSIRASKVGANHMADITPLSAQPGDAVTLVCTTKDGTVTASMNVRITEPAQGADVLLDGMSVGGNVLSLPVGDSITLRGRVTPATACQSFTWQLSNTNIASLTYNEATGDVSVTRQSDGVVTLQAVVDDDFQSDASIANKAYVILE